MFKKENFIFLEEDYVKQEDWIWVNKKKKKFSHKP